jgi:hypothetical protein
MFSGTRAVTINQQGHFWREIHERATFGGFCNSVFHVRSVAHGINATGHLMQGYAHKKPDGY